MKVKTPHGETRLGVAEMWARVYWCQFTVAEEIKEKQMPTFLLHKQIHMRLFHFFTISPDSISGSVHWGAEWSRSCSFRDRSSSCWRFHCCSKGFYHQGCSRSLITPLTSHFPFHCCCSRVTDVSLLYSPTQIQAALYVTGELNGVTAVVRLSSFCVFNPSPCKD